MNRFAPLVVRVVFCAILLAGTTIASAAPPGSNVDPQDAAAAELREWFLKMCDLAVIEFHKEITTFGDRENADPATHHMPFFEDAHGVRALAVAYDMTGDRKYLEACKRWSDRIIAFQREMIPQGAYYMNHSRAPGQDQGQWNVADSGSIGMAVLATAVRCSDPAEKKRYLASVKAFADLVVENYLGPEGGITNGCWPGYAGQWWCSSATAGCLLFLLYEESGEEKYLQAARGALHWLLARHFRDVRPITFAQRPSGVVFYCFEFYATGLPYLEPGTEARRRAEAQIDEALRWVCQNRPADQDPSKPYPMGTDTAGLPYLVSAFARQLPEHAHLRSSLDEDLRSIATRLFGQGEPRVSHLLVWEVMTWGMLSFAERLSPGTLTRSSHPHPASQAKTAIVVDFGPHPSAEAAAGSQAQVDWLDADTADDTRATECFAAVELQHYLRKMTGRDDDYPIVDDDVVPEGGLILVGGPASNAATGKLATALGVDEKQLAELGPEGYRIKTAALDGRRVTLVAGAERVGTLYAAYDLLYRHGCRWFSPGEIGEEVPRVDRLSELDVTERPAFATRGFLAWEDRGDEDFLLWMARNRVNEWCVEQSNHPLVRKLGIRMVAGLHDAEERFLNPPAAYPYNHPRFQGDEDKPEDPYPPGDEYQGDADGDGVLSYFEAHPEWFPVVDGRRVPGIKGWFGTNYCTSNRHATAEFINNYVDALVDGPYRDADLVRFWTLDGGRWCQCDECKALGIPTDRNLLLVHRLDQEIKRAQADGRIHRPIEIRFLAYHDVLQPPTRPLPTGFDNTTCTATFYPIVRCYVHNFDDPDCPRNAQYRQQLQGWATDPDRHYRGGLCIGEYYNVSGYKCLPICFMHTMAHDLPHYYEVGARQFQYMHVTTAGWSTKALTNYQMARQLWDVQTDCEALWADYFERRYGPAGDPMGKFYESLERMLSNVSELKYGLARRLDRGAEDLFPTPHLRYQRTAGVDCDGPTLVDMVEHGKTCRTLIDQALGMDLPGRIKARIAEDERTFTYGERTINYFHECVQAFQLGRSGRRDEGREHFAEARRLAELLRGDTASTTKSSSHANAQNAFEATYAVRALEHLAKLLGPP